MHLHPSSSYSIHSCLCCPCKYFTHMCLMYKTCRSNVALPVVSSLCNDLKPGTHCSCPSVIDTMLLRPVDVHSKAQSAPESATIDSPDLVTMKRRCAIQSLCRRLTLPNSRSLARLHCSLARMHCCMRHPQPPHAHCCNALSSWTHGMPRSMQARLMWRNCWHRVGSNT
jgi:hypothetical protein